MARCLFTGLLRLNSRQESLLDASGSGTGLRSEAVPTEGGLPVELITLFDTFEIKQQLTPNGIHDGAMVAEGKPSSGADKAGLEERVVHAGHRFHRQNRIPDGSRGHIVLAQDAQSSQLPQVLECIGLLLGDESGSFPPLKLVGTDLQDAQNVLTAIAGHS